MTTQIELKLLQVFLEIYKAKSLTQAARVLGLTQPTISIYLSKLRTHYDDPLFVRASKCMEPTAFAVQFAGYANSALESVHAASIFQTKFKPLAAHRTFHIAMTDMGHVVLLPIMIKRVSEIAPHINFTVSHISEATRGQLETGETDLAVGYMPQLNVGFYQQKMFTQRYVVIAAQDHPRLRKRLSLDSFLTESHVRVNPGGTGQFIVDKILEERGMRRRVLLDLPNYLGLIEIVAQTHLIAIVPHALPQVLKDDDRFRAFELPPDVGLPTYPVKQHWHERNHRDFAHKWLRGVIASLFVDHLEATPGDEHLPIEMLSPNVDLT